MKSQIKVILHFSDAVTNESVNDCLKESLEDLRPYMSTGIDSLDLKPTDPLMIDNVDLRREIPPFKIQTELTNVSQIKQCQINY
jgi:hypothetical protein